MADLSQAQTNYNQIKNQLYLVDESLPLDPDMPLLIKQLEALARLNSVFFETVHYSEVNLQGESEKEEVQEVDFTITLYGDYQSLKSFLNSL
ncbi:type 4a pilus biogenesis protein PilO, partial [Candidatus Saccharibacteria bacterium]|nr:type 4a pilus biogenesis protein PilO [Candidatus Saccharibacteria bacterium]